MKRMTTLVLAAVMLALVGCGGDSHEATAKDALGHLGEFASILEGVKDEASAKAAAGKLDALTAKFEAIKKRKDALPKQTAEENTALEKKVEKDGEPLKKRVETEMTRLTAKPELLAHIQPQLVKLGGAITSLGD